jgi:putative transposase
LSRKVIGSSRFKKVKHKIAKIHAKIARNREWLSHNVSKFLVYNYDEIIMEDLNISGMMKNHKLARAIQNQGWGILTNQISYKSIWYGRFFAQVNRWFPSSKLCGVCGKIDKDLKLSDRVYLCECGNKIDRDKNASNNIKFAGVTANYRALMACKTFSFAEQRLKLRAVPEEMLNFCGDIVL